MALQGEIKTFYMDKEQEQVAYPVTITKAITDENGIKLDQKLIEYETTVHNIQSEVEEKLKTLGDQLIFRLEGTTLYIDEVL